MCVFGSCFCTCIFQLTVSNSKFALLILQPGVCSSDIFTVYVFLCVVRFFFSICTFAFYTCINYANISYMERWSGKNCAFIPEKSLFCQALQTLGEEKNRRKKRKTLDRFMHHMSNSEYRRTKSTSTTAEKRQNRGANESDYSAMKYRKNVIKLVLGHGEIWRNHVKTTRMDYDGDNPRKNVSPRTHTHRHASTPNAVLLLQCSALSPSLAIAQFGFT